jgi:hypothetical protein
MAALVASIALIKPAFHPSCWTAIAEHVNENRGPAALAQFLDAFEPNLLLRAGVLWVAATILLAWPARQRVAPETQNQGVAA